MRKLIGIAFLLVLPFALPTGGTAEGDERVLNFEVATPRNFGYIIGDTIVHEARIAVKAPFLLVPDTIPRPEKVNDWLTVAEVEMLELETEGGRAYTLRITYQIFHEPDNLEWLATPERKLGFAGGGEAFTAVIPAWSFTVMPLVPDLADEFAKDRPALYVPTLWPLVRFGGFAAAFFGLALALCYKKWGRALLYRGPFVRAERDLRRMLRKNAWSEELAKAALMRLHRAFDETAGRSFFAHELPELIAANPWLGKADAAGRFFRVSNRVFFGTQEDRVLSNAKKDSLLGVARALARQERRRGR